MQGRKKKKIARASIRANIYSSTVSSLSSLPREKLNSLRCKLDKTLASLLFREGWSAKIVSAQFRPATGSRGYLLFTLDSGLRSHSARRDSDYPIILIGRESCPLCRMILELTYFLVKKSSCHSKLLRSRRSFCRLVAVLIIRSPLTAGT